MALSIIEPELWAIEVFTAGIGIFDLVGSGDLDLNPMTLIYDLDPYCLELYRMCKYELLTSRLLKVIIRQTTYIHTYTHTYRQTERIDRNYKARRIAGAQ